MIKNEMVRGIKLLALLLAQAGANRLLVLAILYLAL